MSDVCMTNAELIQELRTLRERVAELESTQEALRESEQRYRSFVNNFHGIAYRGRTHFVPVFFHGAVEEITGYTPEELVAGTRRWDELIHADDWPSIAESAEKIRDVPGYSCEREYRITRKDGETRWIREFSQNVCDESGKPQFVQGALYDVTERERAEQGLRQREATLASILRAAPVGIGLVVDRVLKRANERLCSMLGYSRDELIDRSARILYPSQEDYEYVGDEKYRQIRERGTGTVETRWQRKDGSVIDVLLSSAPLDPSDLSSGVTFTALDITGRRQMEARLRAAERMEVMGQLASGVAHEVRNPLNAILAITQALHGRLGEDPQYKPHVDHIRGQVDRLARLMRDLLDFAKPVQTDSLQPVSVLAACASAIDLWRQSQPRVTHLVELAKSPGVHGVQVLGDSARLEQVLVNLLDNAAQHSPEGSKIQVVVSEPDDSLVHISVVDEGTGMSSENLPRVFEPFFSTRTEGTGLGMSIVAHIVEAYRGEVTVRNNDAAPGCTVEIRLPVVT